MDAADRTELSVLVADITTLQVDAVANAANSSLMGGGGVDGAIHRAAGPELARFCAGLGGCPTGEARITPGFRLPARFVIHTVGPVWRGGGHGEADLLARCYASVLGLAFDNGVESLAVPAVSTGIYGFPPAAAAQIAVNATRRALAERSESDLKTLIFCCFSPSSAEMHRLALSGASFSTGTAKT